MVNYPLLSLQASYDKELLVGAIAHTSSTKPPKMKNPLSCYE